jgi:hypothetical protein
MAYDFSDVKNDGGCDPMFQVKPGFWLFRSTINKMIEDTGYLNVTPAWNPAPPVGNTEAQESRGMPDSLRVAGPGDGIANTLAERQRNYGDFSDNAEYAQQIKDVLHGGISWADMPYHMQEALDLIASKIARMLSGDPMYRDSWHDIVGYATLVEQRLTK